MTKWSLAILCSVTVFVGCASARDREQLDGWSRGGAVGSYSGVVLSNASPQISGVALIANAFVVFYSEYLTYAAPTSTQLRVDHQRVSNFAFVGGDTAESESLLIFSERGRDGLRKVLCRDASCSTLSEARLSHFRYGTWRLTDGDVPQLVAEVQSSSEQLNDLVRFECSPRLCDDGAAQIIARSVHVGHLGVASGDNELWVANAAPNSTALDVYHCNNDDDCTPRLVPGLGEGMAVSVDAAHINGTAWFAVTQRSHAEKRSTVTLVACRDAACHIAQDLLNEESAGHVRLTAGSIGPIVAYTNMQDGRLRLAQCSEAECRTTDVGRQGTPYAVALKTGAVVVAYSEAGIGKPRLALCKDYQCVTHEIVRHSSFRDAAPAH